MKINFPYNKDLFLLDKIFNTDTPDNLRIVGGAVRNFLLNKKINDFDLSTTFLPQETQKILDDNNIKNIPTGINFGTVTAIINNKTYEITSTRKDIKTDGRHAVVEYTKDFKIDAERRDFTFNALYLDFKGNIYDYFEGIKDLNKGIVKFIGNPELRIIEDYLRILRFFRFFAYYGNILDNDGLKYSVLYREKLNTLSAERIKHEMSKIFNSNFPINTLKIMDNKGILKIIIDSNNFCYKDIEYFYSIKNFLNCDIDFILPLILFINNKNDLKNIKNKWKFSNKESNEIEYLINHIKDKEYSLNDIKKIIFLNNNIFIKSLIILNGIINKTDFKKINFNLNFVDSLVLPKLPITGNDLIENNFLDKSKYTFLLNEAKNIFIKSNYSLTKKEIIEKLFIFNNLE